MPRAITPATSIETLRKEAKRWLKGLRADEPGPRARFDAIDPAAAVTLRGVQHALAREYGYENWMALIQAVARPSDARAETPLLSLDQDDCLATDLLLAFNAGDQSALDRLNAHDERGFTFDDLRAEIWRRVYAFRQRSFRGSPNELRLDEAQMLIAQDTGFGSWEALAQATATGARRVPAFVVNRGEHRIEPKRRLTDAEWDDLIAAMKAHRITALDAEGLMTGDVLARVATLDHVTALALGGSRQLTDDGVRQLARMPQLQHLNLSEYPLANVARLEGVVDLDLFWHATAITSSGFAHLTAMPQLESLGADGRLSDDEAMRHIAAIPQLRKLRAQESVATDEGFEALSRSRTLESFWGRECPNFGNRGFAAFSSMPSLRELGIGCATIDDDTLSMLPRFPALRALTPIGMTDAGFRHIGRCERLERLTCMYCRETTDEATEHVANLRLKYYYAGLTLISDRSLEVLGRMTSLEEVEFYETKGVTDAG